MNYSSGILFMAFTILILIVCVVLPVIGNWKIFVKAGEPGWKALFFSKLPGMPRISQSIHSLQWLLLE